MASSGGGGHNNDPYEWAWLAGFIIIGAVVFWFWAGDTVSWWGLQIKQLQLQFIGFFRSDDSTLLTLQNAIQGSLLQADKIDFQTFVFVFDAVGQYLKMPVILLLVGIGAYLFFIHQANHYSQRMNMRQLAEEVVDEYPFALHALRREHHKISLDDPRWGMALTEWGFIIKHKLWNDDHDNMDIKKTEAVLIAQLGGVWRGVDSASPLVQALAGILAMRCVSFTESDDKKSTQLKEDAYEWLKVLSKSAAKNKKNDYLPYERDINNVAKQTRQYLNDKYVVEAMSQHAYTHTVLMRLLTDSRRNGILPSALFNWVKGIDRPLWYALTTVGRRTPFTESLAPFSHYQSETHVGKALIYPVIENAIEGLQESLKKNKRPDYV